MLDEQARAAYRRRLHAIDEALEGAGDVARARLEEERDVLVSELARATGLGGRARRAGSATERARVNAQRRLKDAVTRIGEIAPAIGAFLEDAVRTGTYCCFKP
jgi:hypothetical protein